MHKFTEKWNLSSYTWGTYIYPFYNVKGVQVSRDDSMWGSDYELYRGVDERWMGVSGKLF